MKFILLTLLVFLVRQAFAQDTASHRLVISLSGGALSSPNPGRNVAESFSYTSTPAATGVASAQQFSGSLGGNFPPVDYVGDIMNFEVTSHRHAINGGIGLFQTRNADGGGYLKAGYARVLRFHLNQFRFQPGVELYEVLGSQMELGRIDNRGQTLQLLGHTAAPEWTEQYTNSSGNHTAMCGADYLSVLYRRDALLIQPAMTLSVSFRRLVLGIRAGWTFQLAQGCLLILKQQNNSGDSNTIARIHEPKNGSESGFYTSLSIGLINRPSPFCIRRASRCGTRGAIGVVDQDAVTRDPTGPFIPVLSDQELL